MIERLGRIRWAMWALIGRFWQSKVFLGYFTEWIPPFFHPCKNSDITPDRKKLLIVPGRYVGTLRKGQSHEPQPSNITLLYLG